MGGAARFVRTLIPRGRYLPFGSCPCRSRGFDTWRPPAVQGHGGFATPTAEAAPPILIHRYSKPVIPGPEPSEGARNPTNTGLWNMDAGLAAAPGRWRPHPARRQSDGPAVHGSARRSVRPARIDPRATSARGRIG